MWVAIGVATYLAATVPTRWTWALDGLIVALAAVSAVAGIPRRRAVRRLVLRGSSGSGGAVGVVQRRRALTAASRLMPGFAGRRWLAEAESLLTEVAAARRAAALRSYLLSAPRLIAMLWGREILRRVRPGPRRPR
jgi:hypothetical protein